MPPSSLLHNGAIVVLVPGCGRAFWRTRERLCQTKANQRHNLGLPDSTPSFITWQQRIFSPRGAIASWYPATQLVAAPRPDNKEAGRGANGESKTASPLTDVFMTGTLHDVTCDGEHM